MPIGFGLLESDDRHDRHRHGYRRSLVFVIFVLVVFNCGRKQQTVVFQFRLFRTKKRTGKLRALISINVGICEGFRMTAQCDVAAGHRGRRPKASREGTRGKFRRGIAARYGIWSRRGGWGGAVVAGGTPRARRIPAGAGSFSGPRQRFGTANWCRARSSPWRGATETEAGTGLSVVTSPISRSPLAPFRSS